MKPVVIDLPMPPSVNNMFANIPGRGRVRSKRYKTWANAAGWFVNAARPTKLKGHFTAAITLSDAKRRGDADNRIKPILDLLQSLGVVENDSLCDSVSVTWGVAPEGCRVSLYPALEPVPSSRRQLSLMEAG